MNAHHVAVIVVAYNGGASVKACVDALARSEYRDFTIVVVDNASADRSASAGALGDAHVLTLGENRGFAGGVNAGIGFYNRRFGEPAAYALVNQDCLVAPSWLGPLVATLAADATVAVAGARIYDADGRTLQHAGATIGANGLTRHIGRGSVDAGAYREARDVDYVTGALCAISVDAWRAFGPFDEGYFPAYFEEVDFCVRCRRGGFRVVYVPESEAIHAEASVLGAQSDAYLSAYHAGRMRFATTHLLDRRHLLSALGTEAAWLLSRRSMSEVRPVLRAYRALPALLRARRGTRLGARS